MSTRSKGRMYEIEFEQLLAKLGYKTQRVKGSTKFNKRCDFWDNWDIIAFDYVGWLLVQVRTDYREKVYNQLNTWFDQNKPPLCTGIYAIRAKHKTALDRWSVKYVGNTLHPALMLPFKKKCAKHTTQEK